MPSRSTAIVRLLAAMLMALIGSCSSTLYAPSRGVTADFYPAADPSEISLDNYDFSRLQTGVGLCAFSYEFRGEVGDRITGLRDQELRGLRIWEYEFKDSDWDIKYLESIVKFWGVPGVVGYGYRIRVTYHKDRIVYGGHLVIDMKALRDGGVRVDLQYTGDMANFVDAVRTAHSEITIDTALIEFAD